MTTPIEPRWYCVSRDGIPSLCKDETEARANAAHRRLVWPAGEPHRAVLLGDVAAERETIQRLREALQLLRDAVIAQNRAGASWHSHVFTPMMQGLAVSASILGETADHFPDVTKKV
jgi:hypothetical protein